MPVKLHKLNSGFVGRFSVGDNIVYNAAILCKLAEANTDCLLNKMIVIQVGSILEAALSEIIFRAKSYTVEGVPNISKDDQLKIQGKIVDKFNTIIDVLKGHNVLDGLDADIYRKLHNLRRLRNKIHIQSSINIEDISNKEWKAFSQTLAGRAMVLNLNVLTHLNSEFPRPEHIRGNVPPFCVPTGFPS